MKNLDVSSAPPSVMRRRSFLRNVGMAAATLPTTGVLKAQDGKKPTKGDIAILKLLAAAEIIETDLWQQYSELGGTQDKEVSGVNGGNPLYMAALQILDGDMAQYVHDNTDDELSHAAFLNAYLQSKGQEQVNLDQFRTLPSSTATGAKQIGRLTNLTQLSVDTRFWTRYRSTKNPDLGGGPFDQAVPSLNVG